MAVPFSNTKLRVPKGFQNILEGLAREVLRSQPQDIYAFGAVYFEKMLATREDYLKLSNSSAYERQKSDIRRITNCHVETSPLTSQSVYQIGHFRNGAVFAFSVIVITFWFVKYFASCERAAKSINTSLITLLVNVQ